MITHLAMAAAFCCPTQRGKDGLLQQSQCHPPGASFLRGANGRGETHGARPQCFGVALRQQVTGFAPPTKKTTCYWEFIGFHWGLIEFHRLLLGFDETSRDFNWN